MKRKGKQVYIKQYRIAAKDYDRTRKKCHSVVISNRVTEDAVIYSRKVTTMMKLSWQTVIRRSLCGALPTGRNTYVEAIDQIQEQNVQSFGEQKIHRCIIVINETFTYLVSMAKKGQWLICSQLC